MTLCRAPAPAARSLSVPAAELGAGRDAVLAHAGPGGESLSTEMLFLTCHSGYRSGRKERQPQLLVVALSTGFPCNGSSSGSLMCRLWPGDGAGTLCEG